jgi:3-oxoacyl-[acyl-carrier-protein] synthase II
VNKRQVVVTGIGVVSPHGDDPVQMFDALMAGNSAITFWGHPDVPPAIVATAPFDPTPWFSRGQMAGIDRVSQFAVAAAESAQRDAGWSDVIDKDRVGVFVGCGMGGAGAIDEAYARLHSQRRMSPLTVIAGMTNAPAAHIAIRGGFTGPVYTYSIACASSAVAIAEAAKAIACDDLDAAVVGGAEALLFPGTVKAWQALQTLASPDTADPASACRPFALDRSGFALAEGAAFLVLESKAHALARGVRCYAELAGAGVSSDATHLTKPDAAGQVRALTAALRQAGLSPADIGYCNAHGTATSVGDVAECLALRQVWGDDLATLRVSSTKSMHGHLLGAAGALEAVITVLALQRGQRPPTGDCLQPDPACDIPLIRGQGDDAPELHAAISNSFAFGGTNAVLAFRRFH